MHFDLGDLLTSHQRLNQNLNHFQNQSQAGSEASNKEKGIKGFNQSTKQDPQLPTLETSIIGYIVIKKPESALIPEGYRVVGDHPMKFHTRHPIGRRCATSGFLF